MNASTRNMLHDHDPEPEALDHSREVAILAMLSKMRQASVMVHCSHLFHWGLSEARIKVGEVRDNCRLVDGDLVLKRNESGNFTLESGDRIGPVRKTI